MFRCMLKAAWVLLLTPLCALAFDAVDVLTPASGGIYPAYPSDPPPAWMRSNSSATWASTQALLNAACR